MNNVAVGCKKNTMFLSQVEVGWGSRRGIHTSALVGKTNIKERAESFMV